MDLKKIISKRQNICGLKFNKPQIMGVLNVTPDSFSDGGLFFDKSRAYDQTNLMIDAGAAIIDIGGESTRPGSKVINGEIKNKSKARLIRDGVVVYDGEISSIFREKNADEPFGGSRQKKEGKTKAMIKEVLR